MGARKRPGIDAWRNLPPKSLYVHIPFCASRCFYCDFATYVAPRGAMETYVESLTTEFELLAQTVNHPLETVFFGGGTPTLLDGALLDAVFGALHRSFAVHEEAEITIEANPGTVDAEKLRVLRHHGVNRVSFGAQTMDDRLLMAIGRSHDADAVRRSVAAAKQAGIERINIDLMFGLPDQSLEDIDETLRVVRALDVDHVSAYWLKVEAGTPFSDWLRQGALVLPGEDLEADMYERVRDTLQAAGFLHYEVSNFARPGHEARHNLTYWRNLPYLAAGVSAHGYAFGRRYENVRSLQQYSGFLRDGVRPIAHSDEVDSAEACEDTMMLGLRLREGVNADVFRSRHGATIAEVFGERVDKLIRQGLLVWEGSVLRLSERAWPVANLVFEEFVNVL